MLALNNTPFVYTHVYLQYLNSALPRRLTILVYLVELNLRNHFFYDHFWIPYINFKKKCTMLTEKVPHPCIFPF